VAADAAEAFDWIEEPGLAANGQVEAAVAVRHDIEPCGLLLGDDTGNRVKILFAEERIAERGLERSAGQAAVEPKRSRVGAGDGGGQDQVARDSEHGGLRGLRVDDNAVVFPTQKWSQACAFQASRTAFPVDTMRSG